VSYIHVQTFSCRRNGRLKWQSRGVEPVLKWLTKITRFVADESGTSMVEYRLMVALVAAATVTAVTALCTAVSGKFNLVAGAI
jgi:Flp pilus assembly pilin Flp